MNSITGFIDYFKLQDWWLNSFTQEERNHIEQIFQPLDISSDDNSLIEGEVEETDETAAGLLSALSGWFNNKQDRNLAKKIIDKAYSEAIIHNNILDLHFTLQMIIKINYPDRDIDPEALNKTVLACKEQIKIAKEVSSVFKKEYPQDSLPSHIGYEQLRIIFKKNHQFQDGLDLCKQAKEEGWQGNWNKEIEYFNGQINKS